MDRKQTNTTREQNLDARRRSSTLAAGNAAYLEELYEQFLRDPASVTPAWRDYFEQLPRVNGVERDVIHSEVREEFRRLAHQTRPAAAAPATDVGTPLEIGRAQVS